MKKAIRFIIPITIVLIIAGLAIANYMSKRISKNPSDAMGNTPGNLYSGGMFCENDGTIYFANPYDGGKLYSMTSDCEDITYLSDDHVSYINSYGKYLYYIKNDSEYSTSSSVIFRGQLYGVMRCRLNGSHSEALFSNYCTDLALTGNTLVYNANRNSQLVTYSCQITGKDEKVVYQGDVDNAGTINGTTYYSASLDNHCVYTLDTASGSNSLYMDGNTYMACVIDNILYYIDLDNNYALTTVNLATYARTVLTTDRCISYNVYNNVIFYQSENTASDHRLMRMNIDGSNPTTIINGDATSISCTSRYTFFQLYGSDTLYRVQTEAGTTVETFFIQADK